MDIYKELIKPASYTAAFQRLQSQALKKTYMLDRAPVEPEINLRWVLENEKVVVKEIINCIKEKKLIPSIARRTEIFLEKDRVIYSQGWVGKLLQSTFCNIIAAPAEQSYSANLYSFRKGIGSHHAVRKFAAYVKSASKTGVIFIARRDIEKYDKNINQGILIQKFKNILGNQEQYVWDLLSSFIAPEILENNGESRNELPMGYHITPVSENIYLNDLDAAISKIPEIFYIRYGDDLLFASNNPENLQAALTKAEDFVAKLNLNFNASKNVDCSFEYGIKRNTAGLFRQTEAIDYLGFNIDKSGATFISSNKLQKLKKEITRCVNISFAANRGGGMDPIINSLNAFFRFNENSAYLKMLLFSTDNTRKLKQLDTWIAKQVLRKFYKGTQNKIFKNFSFKKLRSAGLMSLQYYKNTASQGGNGIN